MVTILDMIMDTMMDVIIVTINMITMMMIKLSCMLCCWQLTLLVCFVIFPLILWGVNTLYLFWMTHCFIFYCFNPWSFYQLKIQLRCSDWQGVAELFFIHSPYASWVNWSSQIYIYTEKKSYHGEISKYYNMQQCTPMTRNEGANDRTGTNTSTGQYQFLL